MRIRVNCYPIDNPKAYIFVIDQLSSPKGLLEWIDDEEQFYKKREEFESSLDDDEYEKYCEVFNRLNEKGYFKEEELKFCEDKSIPKNITKKIEPEVYPNAM